MNPFAAAAVAVAFWLFLAAAAVAGIIADYRKRQLALEPLRLAIERGQTLDPEVVRQLLGPDRWPYGTGRVDPIQLRMASIIVISAGVGVGILAVFLGQVAPVAVLPTVGAGILVLCIGIGLNIAARMLARERALNRLQSPPA
jgi:hypothetical protein